MAFLIDPQELKHGLILFRRADVQHRNWYCRIKVPGSDRYKTVSLRTADVTTAKEAAFDADADLRFRVKHDVPVFNRTFAQIAKMYADHQQARSKAGEITHHRWEVVESIIRAQINRYVGAKQIAHVSHDDFLGYPLWRRQNGLGRGGRPVSDATIRYEMSIFRSVVAFAVGKRFVPESHVYKGKLPLAKVRREEFTPEE
jgi:integrase